MRQALTILRHTLLDGLRSRMVFGMGGFFALAGWLMLRLGGSSDKALLSLLSLSLALVPLVGLAYGASHFYQARRFMELMLAQPVPRRTLFLGLYAGLSLPLAVSWALGVALPLLASGLLADPTPLLLLLGAGVGLTLVFCAVAFWIAVAVENRLLGLGLAIVAWLALAIGWDGLILLLSYQLADYPLEGPVLALCLANPIDLARLLVLLRFDLGALMGYTGAVFRTFFQGPLGIGLAAAALAAWVVLPLSLAWRGFRRKDF